MTTNCVCSAHSELHFCVCYVFVEALVLDQELYGGINVQDVNKTTIVFVPLPSEEFNQKVSGYTTFPLF